MFRLFSMPSYSCVLGSFQKLLCFFPQMKKPSHSSQKNLNQNADLGYFDPEKFSPPRTKKEPNRLKWLQIDWKGAKIVVVPKLPFFWRNFFAEFGGTPSPSLQTIILPKNKLWLWGIPPPPIYGKHRKNCKSCPTQLIWKVKFKCRICLSCQSRQISTLQPWRQFCTFTFWQQRAL